MPAHGPAPPRDPRPPPPSEGCQNPARDWFPLIDPLGGRVGAVLLRLSDPAAMGDPPPRPPGAAGQP